MKKILFILSVVFVLLGCSQEIQDSKFIGSWRQINGFDEIAFYKDSIVVREHGEHRLTDTWTTNDSTLHLPPLIEIGASVRTLRNLEFKFSNTLDTLYLKRAIDSGFDYSLYRVYNAYDYLLRQNDMQLELPLAKNIEPADKERIAINLLLGYQNDTIASKFQGGDFFNLKTLTSETFDEFKVLRHKSSGDNVQFNLIADKNLSEATIDSITQQLHTIGWKNVFRVYANDQTDYEQTPWLSPITWYGIYE